jgi:thioredoxin
MAGSKTVTADNIQGLIDGGGTVVLDFWASWCGPCRAFAPVFEAAAHQRPEITFGKVDTDAEVELASAFGIRSIPTLMIFREKVLLFSQPGALPKAAFEELLDQVQKVAMKQVHADVAARKASAEAAAR